MPTPAPETNAGHNMQPRIQIVGAGIAGLSLACHLRLKQIPFKIFDAASKPKGHNYGISLSPESYSNLLPALEAKPDFASFLKLTAVDRLVGGRGIVLASDVSSTTQADKRRAYVADASLREALSQGHTIQWNHKVTNTQSTQAGLTLKFENGQSSTAPITIDAGGERSGLTTTLLPDLKPQVLPYAVHHGSRYIAQAEFKERYATLFPQSSNVSEFTQTYQAPYPSSPRTRSYIRLSKAHITQSSLPSPLRAQFSHGTEEEEGEEGRETPIVELRYTISRPAMLSSPISVPDPLYRPARTPPQAKEIPAEFHAELEAMFSQPLGLPEELTHLLSSSGVAEQRDRVLNWLLRVKVLSAGDGSVLAGKGVVAIGDAACSLPILGSEGASRALEEGRMVAEFLETRLGDGAEVVGRDVAVAFCDLEGVKKLRGDAEERSKRWLREVHGEEDSIGDDSRL